MSKNHSWSKPPQPSKYGHTPIQYQDYGRGNNRSGGGPLVFFFALLALLALWAMSH